MAFRKSVWVLFLSDLRGPSILKVQPLCASPRYLTRCSCSFAALARPPLCTIHWSVRWIAAPWHRLRGGEGGDVSLRPGTSPEPLRMAEPPSAAHPRACPIRQRSVLTYTCCGGATGSEDVGLAMRLRAAPAFEPHLLRPGRSPIVAVRVVLAHGQAVPIPQRRRVHRAVGHPKDCA